MNKVIDNLKKAKIHTLYANELLSADILTGKHAEYADEVKEIFGEIEVLLKKQSKLINRATKLLEKESKERTIDADKLAKIKDSKKMYPVKAEFVKPNAFNCKLIIATDRILLSPDSVICSGHSTRVNKDSKYKTLRNKLLTENKIKYIKDNNGRTKLLVTEPISFDDEDSLRKFVLGRNINERDRKIDIMIGSLTLSEFVNFKKIKSL